MHIEFKYNDMCYINKIAMVSTSGKVTILIMFSLLEARRKVS